MKHPNTEHFSTNARAVLRQAQIEAAALSHDHIGTGHLLLACCVIDCSAKKLLQQFNIAEKFLRANIQILSEPLTNFSTSSEQQKKLLSPEKICWSVRVLKVCELAKAIALQEKFKQVNTTCLLLAIVKECDGLGAIILRHTEVTEERLLKAISQTIHSETSHNDNKLETDQAPVDSPCDDDDDDESGIIDEKFRRFEESLSSSPAGSPHTHEASSHRSTSALDKFGKDITDLARKELLDPIIGREKEVDRLIQILCRRRKNNAILIGEAGVGKTAIVEGLAQKIVERSVPEDMLDKRIIALDMTLLVAGTEYRGSFEARLKTVIEEASNSKDVILFLDEIHTIVGAGTGGHEGQMDAANIIKPPLARGEFQCIGATTLDEYRKKIEKDSALARRFQSVTIEEPSPEQTFNILKRLAPSYASHHGVIYTDEALEAAVYLTTRYIPSRKLPDKAIDAIDETGSRLRANAVFRPEELHLLEMELVRIRHEKQRAIAASDFDSAKTYRTHEMNAQEAFNRAFDEWNAQRNRAPVKITAADIAETVASITGIPSNQLTESDRQFLLSFASKLKERIIGQDEVVEVMAKVLQRSRLNMKDPKRPIGAFLLAGPSGVGKTFLAKQLAALFFGSEKALIRLDMSEYMDKYSVSKLFGTQPGYVGYEEGGFLTERVHRRPYSVLLFDEFDKAHPDIANTLLQILEEGSLTDGHGRYVDFRNTIILLTSNIGCHFNMELPSLGFLPGVNAQGPLMPHAALQERIMKEVQQTLRPELINRFDDILVFKFLTDDALDKILTLELNEVQTRLASSGITFELTDAARAFVLKKGYNPKHGARPLRRAIETHIENPLIEALLSHDMAITTFILSPKPTENGAEPETLVATPRVTARKEKQKKVSAVKPAIKRKSTARRKSPSVKARQKEA